MEVALVMFKRRMIINHSFFVFCTKGKPFEWLKEYAKCVGVWVVSYTINAVILGALVNFADMNAYLAQIVAVTCTTITSYILFKYFAFKH